MVLHEKSGETQTDIHSHAQNCTILNKVKGKTIMDFSSKSSWQGVCVLSTDPEKQKANVFFSARSLPRHVKHHLCKRCQATFSNPSLKSCSEQNEFPQLLPRQHGSTATRNRCAVIPVSENEKPLPGRM